MTMPAKEMTLPIQRPTRGGQMPSAARHIHPFCAALMLVEPPCQSTRADLLSVAMKSGHDQTGPVTPALGQLRAIREMRDEVFVDWQVAR